MAGGGEGEVHDFSQIDIFYEISLIFFILLGLFVVAIAFEHVVETSVKWVQGNYLGKQIRQHFLMELVALGFISFVLFFTTYAINLNSSLPPEDTNHLILVFEFVHFSIFITTILFMVLVIYLSKFVFERIKLWQKWETMSAEEVERLYKKAQSRYFGGFPFHYWQTENEKMAKYFKIIREAWMTHEDKVPESAYDEGEMVFSQYLQYGIYVVLLFVVNIGWVVWVAYLGLVLSVVIFREIYVAMTNYHGDDKHRNDELFYGIYILNVVFMGLSWLVKRKTYRIVKTIHSAIKDQSTQNTFEMEHTAHNEGRWLIRILKAWFPCCFAPPENMSPVILAFPFRQPDFIIRFYQLNLLYQASTISMFLLVFTRIPVHWALKVTYLFPIIYFIVFYAPTALTFYTTVRFLGPLRLDQPLDKIYEKYREKDDDEKSLSHQSNSAFYVRKHSSMNQIADKMGPVSPRIRRKKSESSNGSGRITKSKSFQPRRMNHLSPEGIHRSKSDIIFPTYSSPVSKTLAPRPRIALGTSNYYNSRSQPNSRPMTPHSEEEGSGSDSVEFRKGGVFWRNHSDTELPHGVTESGYHRSQSDTTIAIRPTVHQTAESDLPDIQDTSPRSALADPEQGFSNESDLYGSNTNAGSDSEFSDAGGLEKNAGDLRGIVVGDIVEDIVEGSREH